MKKVISVIMAVVILCVGLLPAASAATACNCSETPIVYIRGRADIVADKTQKQSASNPGLPTFYGENVEGYVSRLVPGFFTGSTFGNWDKFSSTLTEIFAEEYKDYALDKNGNVDNNSGISLEKQWSADKIKDVHKAAQTVQNAQQASKELYKYYFIYDVRIDTFEVADELHKYIETVKKASGHSKVKILARCFGTNVLSAYLVRYGWNDIEDVLLYNPIMYGTDKLDCIFTGEIKVTRDSIDYIANNMVIDSESDATVQKVAQILNKSGSFDSTGDTASFVANYCASDILRETYATCPGYWSMLSADAYEKAKEYIFEYYEDEYSKIIEKADYYHENVRLKLDEIYADMKADGVDIYTVVKYGAPLLPIMENPNVQSDDTVTVETQVPGAVTAPLGSTFGEAYMEDAAARGTAKYISPDKTVDASGIFSPDTTWFVKDLPHDIFPQCLDLLLYKTLRAKGTFTINSDKNYPQFMVYENNDGTETVKPLKTVDENDQPLDLLGDLLLFIQKIQAVIIKILREYLLGIVL